MGNLLSWVSGNWFTLLQTSGIVGSLFFTAISVRQATKTRKTGDLLALTQQHRDLWNAVYTRPELGRIFLKEVDLLEMPITVAEERFLNEVVIHFQLGHNFAREESFLTQEAMAADIRSFFSLPVPRAVWNQSKQTRDPVFVKYVDECLAL